MYPTYLPVNGCYPGIEKKKTLEPGDFTGDAYAYGLSYFVFYYLGTYFLQYGVSKLHLQIPMPVRLLGILHYIGRRGSREVFRLQWWVKGFCWSSVFGTYVILCTSQVTCFVMRRS